MLAGILAFIKNSRRRRGQGWSTLAFLVGGSLGVSDELRRQAHLVWSMSTLTLPHELAQLVLAEQLYRACTIIRGEPYHK